MNKILIYKYSLRISFSLILFWALVKLQHWPGAEYFLSAGVFVILICMIVALHDIYGKYNKSTNEKFMWLIAFILCPWVSAFIYYFLVLKEKK